MDLEQILNPYHHPLLSSILSYLAVAVPAFIIGVALLLSWSSAKAGSVLAFSFFFGSIAYLAFVGFVAGDFQFSWLTIVLFFTGMAVSFGKFSLTTNALIDAALAGVLIAIVGTLAVSGAGLVLGTGFAPHIVGWLVVCALVSIVAGIRSYVKG